MIVKFLAYFVNTSMTSSKDNLKKYCYLLLNAGVVLQPVWNIFIFSPSPDMLCVNT